MKFNFLTCLENNTIHFLQKIKRKIFDEGYDARDEQLT
jgi:hypothetical protein